MSSEVTRTAITRWCGRASGVNVPVLFAGAQGEFAGEDRVKDPLTGEESVVFSCFNQDQALDHVAGAICGPASRRTASRRS